MDDLSYSALRLGGAVVAGGLVGLNRDMYGKPTGVRMHALVALGAAVFTVVGYDLRDVGATSRVIQGIVGGIGFLGAGVIMHGLGGKRPLHLTTASSIWMTAALGVVCGTGEWTLAVLAVAATQLVLILGLPLDKALYGKLGTEGDDDLPG
jgi:putative Mg2+ transporter-C (MgtC) family protein